MAEVQLLGTPVQVRLADALLSSFAADRTTDTEPLLQDRRASWRACAAQARLGSQSAVDAATFMAAESA